MTGILYCPTCFKVLASGPDGLQGTNVGHSIKKGKKTITHTGYKKMVIPETWDPKKHKTADDWHAYLQGIVNKKKKR